jgi:hypothetical protein
VRARAPVREAKPGVGCMHMLLSHSHSKFLPKEAHVVALREDCFSTLFSLRAKGGGLLPMVS